jgi:chromosome segregation ATPase
VLKDHSTDVSNKSSTVTNIEKKGNTIDGSSKYIDSNLNTLTKFKKTLLVEQKTGEEKVELLNDSIESTKKEIDKQRMDLEDLRTKLKKVNEIKESEYGKFIEIRNNLMEFRNKMKNLDEKANDSLGHKLRKERFDMINLERNLNQIDKDIQTKKLTKDEERRLVARSKEMATRLHSLKMIHKKEDDYRTISIQYDKLKTKINSIFQQKSELGDKIGKLKGNLDKLLNLRESLYEERRKARSELREAEAKLEMVDTQLNAIEYRRARQANFRTRFGNIGGKRDFKYDNAEERIKRNKENLELLNIAKEAALKKMSSGRKLTFYEMKLIYGDELLHE